jgi:hypothetical protein
MHQLPSSGLLARRCTIQRKLAKFQAPSTTRAAGWPAPTLRPPSKGSHRWNHCIGKRMRKAGLWLTAVPCIAKRSSGVRIGSQSAMAYDDRVMPKFTGLSLHTLNDRLGRPSGKGMRVGSGPHRHAFHIFWFCNGPNGPACYAYAETRDRSMPPDLTPWEQEIFDSAGFRREDWTLKPCP